MSRPDKSTIKAFALSATLGAVLKSNQNGEPKLVAMQLQINRSMQVFYRKAGPKLYWNISHVVGDIWEEIAARHQNTIKEEEVPKFIEYLCMLVPPKNFKTFLAMQPYKSSVSIRSEVNARIVESILLLDQRLNEYVGTRAYALTLKKPKIEKVKKIRDKSKKVKKSTQSTSKQLKERQRHSNAKSFLQQRIEAARAKKENT